MSLVMAFTSILFILYNNRDDRQNRPYLLFLFMLCVVASLAAVLTPGNYMPAWKNTRMRLNRCGQPSMPPS